MTEGREVVRRLIPQMDVVLVNYRPDVAVKLGIDPKKVMTIFNEHGNIGPASVPIVLSKLKEMGRLKKGDRVALLGIGSGLNCSMAEVEW